MCWNSILLMDLKLFIQPSEKTAADVRLGDGRGTATTIMTNSRGGPKQLSQIYENRDNENFVLLQLTQRNGALIAQVLDLNTKDPSSKALGIKHPATLEFNSNQIFQPNLFTKPITDLREWLLLVTASVRLSLTASTLRNPAWLPMTTATTASATLVLHTVGPPASYPSFLFSRLSQPSSPSFLRIRSTSKGLPRASSAREAQAQTSTASSVLRAVLGSPKPLMRLQMSSP